MKPPPPVVKSLASGSVNSARLGVRMKTQSRCLTQAKSPSSQVSSINENSARLTKEKVLSRHFNPVTKKLRSTWSSNRDLGTSSHLCENINKGPNWASNAMQVQNKYDETFIVEIPKQKHPNSKNMEKHQSNKNLNQHFVQLLKKKDTEIRAALDKNRHLEDKIDRQSEELIVLNEIHSKLNTELDDMKDEIASKSLEIEFHKSETMKMREALEHQYEESYKKVTEMQDMNCEIMRLQEENFRLLESMRSQEADLNNLHVDLKQDSEDAQFKEAEVCFVADSNKDLEKETADFLEKVSMVCKNKSLKIKALSKDKNVKINLKITVRKERLDRISHQLSFSEAFESPGIFAKTPCQTFSVKDEDDDVFHTAPSEDKSQINKLYDELFQNENATLFANPCESLTENCAMKKVDSIEICEPLKGFNDNEPVVSQSVDANLNCETYRVSLGTLDRADELDTKLQELWTRLSSQTDTLEELKSEKRRFTFSVDLLEEELTESRTQHKKLVDQVNVVKKLFC